MTKRLPTKLEREPLVDAVCELRVDSSVDLHTILPGVLFTRLAGGVGRVEQLPAMNLPDALRGSLPLDQLNNQLIRISWGEYFITLGTRNVVVGAKLPYRGWPDFKSKIQELFDLVLDQSFVTGVSRYSIKYTNLIEVSGLVEQHKRLDVHVRVGSSELQDGPLTLRCELRRADFATIIEIGTGANVQMAATGKVRSGCLVDVDTIYVGQRVGVGDFKKQLSSRLDDIRRSNKVDFFDCLRDEAIAEMGAKYE